MEMELVALSDAETELAASGADLPGELLAALVNRLDKLYDLRRDGVSVGVALAAGGRTAFISVYIRPAFRRQGLGGQALRLLEERLSGAERIMTAYPAAGEAGRAFAAGHGYRRSFSSALMRYDGPAFTLPPLPVRGYLDGDYDAAHALYARAFHEMRLSTGDFPDSVVESPSERMRRYWAETANERLVYLWDGTPVGYAHVEGCEIGSVAVLPEAQGRGIGRGFVQYICNAIRQQGYPAVTLFCVAGNRARRLYDTLGFRALTMDDYAVKPAAGPRLDLSTQEEAS